MDLRRKCSFPQSFDAKEKVRRIVALAAMNGLKALLRTPWLWRARREERALAGRPHHELAVCAVFREEAPFLEEWISFHVGIGATHFYLYNNFSTDDFAAVLAPWEARGFLTVHDWPRRVGQCSAYADCARRYRKAARWIAFLDVDEFLFSPDVTDIRPLLREYEAHPGVLVYGLFFGAAGHEARPGGSLLKNFTRRAPTSFKVGGKTIANPRMIRAVRTPHTFAYWRGEAIDTARRRLKDGRGAPVFDRLRYNHYWSRSLADLRTKVARGDASTAQARDLAWHLAFEAQLNAEEDRAILPVRARIESEGSSLRATPA